MGVAAAALTIVLGWRSVEGQPSVCGVSLSGPPSVLDLRHMKHFFFAPLSVLFLAVALLACGSSDPEGRLPPSDASPMGDAEADAGEPIPTGLPVLGGGMHVSDSVEMTTIATAAEAMDGPRDLAFNPEVPGQLWVINLHDSSTVVISDVGTADQVWLRHAASGNTHFNARPAAMAFGAPGSFATAPEEDSVTQPSTPEDFMGPSLWTSDLTIFDGGHTGHIDMLHNSPNSVGIAWDHDNVYWVIDGMHHSVTRYDFQTDHGPGGADHSDGIIARYVEGEIGYTPDVPSHAELDHDTGLLYVADTGNNRIATLDTARGIRGARVDPNYDGIDQYLMQDTALTTFVDGAAAGLEAPSGLALHEGHVFITDNATSRIVAFDLEGNEVDYLDLSDVVSAGSLMGIAVGPEGALYLVDSAANEVLRITALSGE